MDTDNNSSFNLDEWRENWKKEQSRREMQGIRDRLAMHGSTARALNSLNDSDKTQATHNEDS